MNLAQSIQRHPAPYPNNAILQNLQKQAAIQQQKLRLQQQLKETMGGQNASSGQIQQQQQQQELKFQLLQEKSQQNAWLQEMTLESNTPSNPSFILKFYHTKTSSNNNSQIQDLQLHLDKQIASQGNKDFEIPPQRRSSSAAIRVSPSSGFIIEDRSIIQQKQKEDIANMLEFLVENMHYLETDQLFEKKKELIYLNAKDQSIFENIMNQYQFSKKSKDKMISYILRICFKFLKGEIKQHEMHGQKDKEVAFTLKYFGNETEILQELSLQRRILLNNNNNNNNSKRILLGKRTRYSQENFCEEFYSVNEEQKENNENYDSSFDLLAAPSNKILPPLSTTNHETINSIPFKQECLAKSKRIQFIRMIFRSEAFARDYQLFLEKFQELADEKNKKKISKCAQDMQNLLEKGKNKKVKSYKKLPWLKLWLLEAYNLSKNLKAYAEEEALKEEINVMRYSRDAETLIFGEYEDLKRV